MSKEPQTPAAPARKTRATARPPAAQGAAAPAPTEATTEPAASASTAAPADRDEAVRRMAYSLYEARGYIGGHEVEDWLRAEALVALASIDSPAARPQGGNVTPAPARRAASRSAASGTAAPTKAAPKATAPKAAAAKKTPAKRAPPKSGGT